MIKDRIILITGLVLFSIGTVAQEHNSNPFEIVYNFSKAIMCGDSLLLESTIHKDSLIKNLNGRYAKHDTLKNVDDLKSFFFFKYSPMKYPRGINEEKYRKSFLIESEIKIRTKKSTGNYPLFYISSKSVRNELCVTLKDTDIGLRIINFRDSLITDIHPYY